MDLAAALAALDLDPDDPDDAAAVAIVRVLADRHRRQATPSPCPDELGTGPRITRIGERFPVRPTDRWHMPRRGCTGSHGRRP